MDSIVSSLEARLAPAGLDLVIPLAVGWYNSRVPPEFRLPEAPDRLAVLVGNTRALWPRFLEAFRGRPDLQVATHPLDRFVEETLHRALKGLPEVLDLRLAPEPPPRRVALQQAAEAAGLAWLSPAHLSIHPEFGPWISLRALVVFGVPGPGGPARTAPPCRHRCEDHCLPALGRALEAGWDPDRTWRLWAAAREACPQGGEHRFPEDALYYHYTKDRSGLEPSAPEGRSPAP